MMKIALTADPEIPVPPLLYGGIERIVDMLVEGLMSEGHDVTLFAHPESDVKCRLIGWKGRSSQRLADTLKNTRTLYQETRVQKFDLIHSFGRLAYLLPLLPHKTPKIMSYQREPSLRQISRANWIAKKGTLQFTGCSHYITEQIKPVATATTIYNGVSTGKYSARYSVDPDAPLVFLGRIEPIKGTHIAVEVARETGRKLIIAGNVPTEGREYFEKQIRPFLNESIQYIGPVNDEQKNSLLGQASAFLMPIQWNEPFGIVMVEAMACGTPVIGLAYGALPEVVEEGVNGFKCNNVGEMIDKVGKINTIDRRRVRQLVEEKFSSGVIVNNYINLYSGLIKANNGKLPSTKLSGNII